MANIIKVKSLLPDNRVALHEHHPDHPGGEAFVAGDREIEVAETNAVKVAIKQDRLEVVKSATKATK